MAISTTAYQYDRKDKDGKTVESKLLLIADDGQQKYRIEADKAAALAKPIDVEAIVTERSKVRLRNADYIAAKVAALAGKAPLPPEEVDKIIKRQMVAEGQVE